ncbi:nicotinamide-nucleotide adenylyltransferase [Streptomyces sp. NPDC006640]|uniref:nicotinamide-nucleotide adenylyltransferase n=1 Tax=unclassified Streptomyces TaxID=2593676 RepID=UPI0036A39DDC
MLSATFFPPEPGSRYAPRSGPSGGDRNLVGQAASCVFPGRFQPFHNGHALALTHAAELYERVIVAISNAHISHTENNPFTGGERYEMIDCFLRQTSLSSNVTVIPIPVDDAPTTWVATILSVCPRFDNVYTRSPWTQSLFEHWGIPNSKTLLTGHPLSASEVRKAMAGGDEWQQTVPEGVADLLVELDGPARLRALLSGKNHRLSLP